MDDDESEGLYLVLKPVFKFLFPKEMAAGECEGRTKRTRLENEAAAAEAEAEKAESAAAAAEVEAEQAELRAIGLR